MKGTREDDGDYQFDLALEQNLRNGEKTKQVYRMLVVEVTPKDQRSSLVQIPKNGDRLQPFGAWVE